MIIRILFSALFFVIIGFIVYALLNSLRDVFDPVLLCVSSLLAYRIIDFADNLTSNKNDDAEDS